MQPVVLIERDIESVHTQVIIQTFSDRVLVIVTQLQKVGTLVRSLLFYSTIILSDATQIHASIPTTVSLAETPSDDVAPDTGGSTLAPVHPSIDLTYLFGNASSPDQQTLYSSYAAQIATLVWTSERDGQIGTSHNPVVIGIALKPPPSSERPSDTDRATFLQVMDLVREALGTVHT